MITWSPVSVRGPVSKQKNTPWLVLLIVSPRHKSVSNRLQLITFSGHSLDFFVGRSDSIEEKQTYTRMARSGVLVMHRPDIRQEPKESERKLQAVEICGPPHKIPICINSFVHVTIFCQSKINENSTFSPKDTIRSAILTNHQNASVYQWLIYSKLIIQRWGHEHF